MQKTLAMKLLHEDMVIRKQLVGRFTREARAISRLSNPHTVRIYDFGRHEAVFYLVMEYLDGEDVEIILSRDGPMAWRRALSILDQVCESLEEAHDAGIVHRDLKPENIMIVKSEGQADFVKVLDFGLAKIHDGTDVFSVHSHRDLFGTPFYMSPEQIRNESVDRRGDVYSLGCLSYRMLTNKHAFDAKYAFDVLRKHLTGPIPSIRESYPSLDIPIRLEHFVRRALAKNPKNRFQDMSVMRRAIQECLEDPDDKSETISGLDASIEDEILQIDDVLEARLKAFAEAHRVAQDDPALQEPYYEQDSVSPRTFEMQDEGEAVRSHQSEESQADPGLSQQDVAVVEKPESEAEPSPKPEPDTGTHLAVIGFERSLRQRRWILATLLSLVAISVIGAGIYLWLNRDPVPGIEIEPNNNPSSANVLSPGETMTGHLGKKLTESTSDRDYYRLALGDAGQYLDARLTALPDVDLKLDILDDAGERVVMSVNNAGKGQEETVHRLYVENDTVTLRVSESVQPGQSPTENVSEPYRLKTKVYASTGGPSEIEPNNQPHWANALQLGIKTIGNLDGPKDRDFFHIQADPPDGPQHWLFSIDASAEIVPEIKLYSRVGKTGALETLFSWQGVRGELETKFVHWPGWYPNAPNESYRPPDNITYYLSVNLATAGARRGPYSFQVQRQAVVSMSEDEPNNDRARATRLTYGQPYRGRLDNANDVDTYRMTVPGIENRDITVEFPTASLSKVTVEITDRATQVSRMKLSSKTGHISKEIMSRKTYRGTGAEYYVRIRPTKRTAFPFKYTFRVLRELGKPTSGAP